MEEGKIILIVIVILIVAEQSDIFQFPLAKHAKTAKREPQKAQKS